MPRTHFVSMLFCFHLEYSKEDQQAIDAEHRHNHPLKVLSIAISWHIRSATARSRSVSAAMTNIRRPRGDPDNKCRCVCASECMGLSIRFSSSYTWSFTHLAIFTKKKPVIVHYLIGNELDVRFWEPYGCCLKEPSARSWISASSSLPQRLRHLPLSSSSSFLSHQK